MQMCLFLWKLRRREFCNANCCCRRLSATISSTTDPQQTCVHSCSRKAPCRLQTATLYVKYIEMWRKMKRELTLYSEIRALLHEEFLSASVCRAWGSGASYTDGMNPYRIQRIRHLEPADMFSRLELCRWINADPIMIRNIFFNDEAHFTGDGIHNTRKSHLWDCYNPHGNVKSNQSYCVLYIQSDSTIFQLVV